ncbi:MULTISPECIES: GNAT family N-acetyltransferase [Streptomyces]|uniref:GNAT family N-acetyltransferase n=1 Tax=Streptomyces TaxID=1883 RepID=UPI001E3016A9|nr:MULTISPECIES: GNAT family N-acetyltransferase [Streptomyces]UFQ14060.1 GNAT family N-acetyltransferase [Streptomyces huasconensis]WCL83659.1 GNAT family N-acetyltransferase [Streptomyces sp. JCM 35825]
MNSPSVPDVQVLRGGDVLAHSDALRSVYLDAFSAPPWNEDEEQAAEFAERLRDDARRPGFTAALAVAGRDVLGFASGWTTLTPFPTDRCYPQVAAGLGARRTNDWLCGAFEVDELAVRPGAHGSGLAGRLLAAATEGAPDGRSWLLTSVRTPRAMAFYHRQGWAQATHPSADGKGIVVFLGPRHPARGLVPLPL